MTNLSLRQRLTGLAGLLSFSLLLLTWILLVGANRKFERQNKDAILTAVSRELMEEMEPWQTADGDFPEMLEEIEEAIDITAERLAVLRVRNGEVVARSHPRDPNWPADSEDWLTTTLPYHGEQLVVALYYAESRDMLKQQAVVLGMAAPVLALIHQQFTSLYFYYWYLSYALPVVIIGVALGFHRLVLPWLRTEDRTPRFPAIASAASLAFFALFFWQVTPGSGGKPNRLDADTPWPVNEDGEAAVEFRRGTSHWIATQDGQPISLKNHYQDEGERNRAGR